MKLDDFEFSDCNVKRTLIGDKVVSIILSSAYYIPDSIFIDNIILSIKNWSDFSAYMYISQSPFSVSEEKKLANDDFDFFDLIQEKEINSNEIILKGFGKNSGQWIKYIFKDCQYDISINNKNVMKEE